MHCNTLAKKMLMSKEAYAYTTRQTKRSLRAKEALTNKRALYIQKRPIQTKRDKRKRLARALHPLQKRLKRTHTHIHTQNRLTASLAYTALSTSRCAAMLGGTATHCNKLQHDATHCKHTNKPFSHRSVNIVLRRNVWWYRNTLQHTATRCNTLQHTNTPLSHRSVKIALRRNVW